MEEKNELNDIILNKNDTNNNNKKIIFAVATLGVILIIVVVLMNSLSSDTTNNLPKAQAPEAILPPEPKMNEELASEPLFQEIEVIEDEPSYDENLDMIAKKLKQESEEKDLVVENVKPKKPLHKQPVEVKVEKTKPSVKKVEKHIEKKKPSANHKIEKSTTKKHYIQVGSFSIYKPNKKFLKSITDNGFSYKFHEVIVNGKSIKKVLVGPFGSRKDAKNALKTVRDTVIAGAFIVKI